MKTTSENCDTMHDDWYERRAVPRIRLLLVTSIGSVLGAASVILLFIINSQIKSHELTDRDTLVTRREFSETVGRIENSIEKLDNSVNKNLDSVSEKLDRNLRAVERMRGGTK